MSEEIRESTSNYWAMTPLQVLGDDTLSHGARNLYGLIASLSNVTSYCWASNQYLADFFKVNKTTISLWIKSLKDAGYIIVEYEYKDDTKEIDMRKIWLPWNAKIKSTNNIPINNTPAPAETKPAKEEKYKDEIKEIIDYLNIKLNSNYRYGSESNNKYIRARLNEGFTVDNFKQVIDVKYDEWIKKPEMVQYLRPSTLFGNKFEQYLNQKTYKSPQAAVKHKDWDGTFTTDKKY